MWRQEAQGRSSLRISSAPPRICRWQNSCGAMMFFCAFFISSFVYFFVTLKTSKLCVYLIVITSSFCLTGRSHLGVPAWLGWHQQPQWPAHGPADVSIRYSQRLRSRSEILAYIQRLSQWCCSCQIWTFSPKLDLLNETYVWKDTHTQMWLKTVIKNDRGH